MTDLKPCPFCGGKAEFARKQVKTKGHWCDAVYVRCTNCDARSNRVLYSAKYLFALSITERVSSSCISTGVLVS